MTRLPRPTRLAPIAVALVTAFALAAPIDEMAELHAASIARSPVGAWVKFKDASGKEVRSTLLEKRETPEGWMIRNRLDPGGETSSLVGSANELSRRGQDAASVAAESLEVAGKKLACRVFTLGNGQRHWISPEVPLGGFVKIVTADGTPVLTVIDWGTAP